VQRPTSIIQILLIEDDSDDYVLTRELIREIPGEEYALTWASTPDEAFRLVDAEQFHICLVDYHLGAETGSEVIERLRRMGFDGPIIVLTGQDDYDTDMEVMHAGADDYLLKSELTARLLERSLRYARERYHMIGALRESRAQVAAALRNSESRFRRLADSNMIGIIVGDMDGAITEANDAFLAMVGYARAEFDSAKLPWSDVMLHWQNSGDLRATEEILERGSCAPFETQLPRRDGGTTPALAGMALMEENSRQVVGFVIDLSERKKFEHESREARERAESANRAKDDFLAMLSHELRTPLTPVLGALDILSERNDLPAELAPYVEIIERNILLESHLIDDLLDMSRILRGKLPLSVAEVDLHATVANALAVCAQDIEGKHIVLTVESAAPLHRVSGDSARLQQVFWNLLKNAAKFTPPAGSITVRSRTIDDAWCEISVADSGIGIEPDMLAAIFDPFEQGGAATNKRFGGLGLGLSISKRLIDIHGGQISAASDGPGTGATFTVRLPLIGTGVADGAHKAMSAA
jgi:PAS domain S-box-containing protein